ncbi:MAG: 50S ribosomal protein L20 [Candidatus Syntrophonatronum acetioxidans]|uniref:Large ribosomal subunit protein bL20 n=1 Tax=Candidatus Syntrophonatronum acetioxidans TaxID=1795816 RepID=A0A424YGW2_9FIRM|nr:MAG: 50S ribosomal protein L20 [Candidatus Syntrophonatronum acetioxidans]
MARVKRGATVKRRHKKILKLAKGYRGSTSKIFKLANQQVMRSLAFAYRDRRQKKRDFRKLWITRINAAARQNGMSYSKLMNGLKKAGVEINRKMLADLAVNDEKAFSQLVQMAREQFNS